MVLKIIQQITNTENKSKEIIKKSHVEAKIIIEKAKQDSIRLLTSAQNEAKTEKLRLIEEATDKANKEALSLQKTNEEKIKNILQIAKKNEALAIKFVTANIMEI